MGDKRVRIRVDGPDFIYEPATLTTNGEGTVTWHCDQSFGLHFGDRTPFQKLRIQSPAGSVTIPFDTGRPLALGTYKYTVAVCRDDGVLIDQCPEIIIDDSRGG